MSPHPKNAVLHKPLTIQKNDGHLEPYQSSKLKRSLLKAARLADTTELSDFNALDLLNEIENSLYFEEKEVVSALYLDNLVKKVLLLKGYQATLEHYQEFQSSKQRSRQQNRDIDYMITKLLAKDKTVVNENANKDSNVFNTQRDLTME